MAKPEEIAWGADRLPASPAIQLGCMRLPWVADGGSSAVDVGYISLTA